MNLVVFKMQQTNDVRLRVPLILGVQEDADQSTTATETFACSQSLKGCSPCRSSASKGR